MTAVSLTSTKCLSFSRQNMLIRRTIAIAITKIRLLRVALMLTEAFT